MTTTTETAYDYHCREYKEFYEENQQEEYGDNKEDWEDIDDFATSLHGDLEEVCSSNQNPFALVQYSAGVYSGEVENALHPDQVKTLLEGYKTHHTDLLVVAANLENEDAHADFLVSCCEKFGEALYEPERPGDFLPSMEDLEPALFAYMKLAATEYTCVLRIWNYELSEEDFWAFWKESVRDTFQENGWQSC